VLPKEKRNLKRVISVLLIVMLFAEILAFTVSIQPAWANADLSVSITPLGDPLTGGLEVGEGQSQIFNSTVTGGYPPYSYYWIIGNDSTVSMFNGIYVGTESTYNFTAPMEPYIRFLTLVVDDSQARTVQSNVITVWSPPPMYFSVEPVATGLLTNINASINGLETLAAQSLVGQNFTVEIHLRNVTVTDVPLGVAGLEVHFYFGNILNYCKPVGFTNMLGQPGGALEGGLLYPFTPGFYNDTGWFYDGPIVGPPYTNATQYMVAAASTEGPWNGNDGLVARITFQITAQPSQEMGQQDFNAQLQLVFADMRDGDSNKVPFYVTQGTLRIDSDPKLLGDINGDGKVSLQDLVLLASAYGSHFGDTNWNADADLAPPWLIISLTDLVTAASHYGQRYP
jgi:hypothetical protein